MKTFFRVVESTLLTVGLFFILKDNYPLAVCLILLAMYYDGKAFDEETKHLVEPTTTKVA